jgi:ABC-2 type transport system ATP-binding protein
MLSVSGLSHRFGDRQALDGVSFTVESGSITGLLGPNGAGKTTLIRVLLGIIVPDAGSVSWAEVAVDDTHRGSWGYMPQERGLYQQMTAGAQLVHFARLRGAGKATATQQARELLAEVGLADRWDDRTDRLSGGMQQRLQLAVALVHDPSVVILDEPYAGLDPIAADDLSTTLARRAEQGCTVVLSSHQLDLVQDQCESIVMIDHGRLVLEGRVAELRAGSSHRRLRLTINTVDRSWLAPFDGVRIVDDQADALRLDLGATTEPLAVLDAARAAATVSDFGLELPTLSELFLAAVGQAP